MIDDANILKWKWLNLLLLGFIILGCGGGDKVNSPDAQGKVVLSSPTVEPNGSLSLDATARFEAKVSADLADTSLVYAWSLKESRGTLVVEGVDQGAQIQTSTPFVSVRGDQAGDERISVKVMEEGNENPVGEDQLSFTITIPDGAYYKCFDEPLLFFRNNNWENPVVTAVGLESDTRKEHRPPAQNWLMDISPDGNWFMRLDFSDRNRIIWLDACDGSENRNLAKGLRIEEPVFGPTGKYIYYSELIEYPEQPWARTRELVRLDVETGETKFISKFGEFSSSPRVSPDGKWIVFKYTEEIFSDHSSFPELITHLAVMPSEGGPANFLALIDEGTLGGMDWSPDSKDIIFHWNMPGGSSETRTDGIYRVNRVGGGAPFLIYPEPDVDNTTLFYYAKGTRIAFFGHPTGDDTQYDIWSIDANGNDLQRLTDERYNVFLSFIWEPN